MSRIVQAANFVAPHSGGIRTVLEHLAVGYAAAGHEVVQVVPAKRASTQHTPWGRRVTVPGHVLPRTGYRIMGYGAAERTVAGLEPDRLEVHDRSTLRGLSRWARVNGVPALVVSHERLDRLATQWLPDTGPVRLVADHSNRTLAKGFDTVVCTTEWAATEFHRVGATNVRIVPLAVDAAHFSPGVDLRLRRRFASDDDALIVMTSRMSREKRPDLAIRMVEELVMCREVPVALAVAGDGPMRAQLQRLAGGLPITFTGHLDRAEVAALLATADVAVAPGPVETFGLAALEALASGTPVVCNHRSALPEVLGVAGVAAAQSPQAFADGLQSLLARPVAVRRAAARRRAETFDWQRTVRGFLDVHDLRPRREVRAA